MSRNRPATAGVAALPSPSAATPDPVIELASELFVKMWVPKGSSTDEHLASQCLIAAAAFYDAVTAPPKQEFAQPER